MPPNSGRLTTRVTDDTSCHVRLNLLKQRLITKIFSKTKVEEYLISIDEASDQMLHEDCAREMRRKGVAKPLIAASLLADFYHWHVSLRRLLRARRCREHR